MKKINKKEWLNLKTVNRGGTDCIQSAQRDLTWGILSLPNKTALKPFDRWQNNTNTWWRYNNKNPVTNHLCVCLRVLCLKHVSCCIRILTYNTDSTQSALIFFLFFFSFVFSTFSITDILGVFGGGVLRGNNSLDTWTHRRRGHVCWP